MRRLAHELAAARGALNVGLAVVVELVKPLNLRIQRDGTLLEPISARQTVELEADTALEIGIPDVATLRIRGGRKDARERVHALEQQGQTADEGSARMVRDRFASRGSNSLNMVDSVLKMCLKSAMRFVVLKKNRDLG